MEEHADPTWPRIDLLRGHLLRPRRGDGRTPEPRNELPSSHYSITSSVRPSNGNGNVRLSGGSDEYRRAFVEKPADLPVQQATRVELVINKKTAKARTKGFARRVTIAFLVNVSIEIVAIHGVLYGGQDFEPLLCDADSDGWRPSVRPPAMPRRPVPGEHPSPPNATLGSGF